MPNSQNTFKYHVTTYECAKRIIDQGFIDPKKSQGKQNVAWYVSRSKVSWAMAHVCQRHACQIEDLAVLTVKGGAGVWLKTSRRGIYASAYKLVPLEMVGAGMWLQREERYISIPRGQRSRTWSRMIEDE